MSFKGFFKPKGMSSERSGPTRGDQLGSIIGQHVKKYGLILHYQPSVPDEAIVDIVFVHGLTGNAHTTWYHEKSGLHWPSELLKKDVSNSRIFTFGYDADVASFWGPSQNRLTNHASNMVADLVGVREDTGTEGRALIFIVHSLGGLVVERALQYSKDSAEQHLHQIECHTSGIVFLGTPHSGSDFALFAKAVARTLGLVGKWVNTDILDVLKRESQVLLDLEDWFAHWLRRRIQVQKPVNITCYFEEIGLPPMGKVVTEESARIVGYSSFGIHANHMNMPKFAGAEDIGYKRVRQELRRWIKQLVQELEKHSDHIN
ncbi:hypothetical protein FQN57_004185, partial [Myotisia sp. PD_48]